MRAVEHFLKLYFSIFHCSNDQDFKEKMQEKASTAERSRRTWRKSLLLSGRDRLQGPGWIHHRILDVEELS